MFDNCSHSDQCPVDSRLDYFDWGRFHHAGPAIGAFCGHQILVKGDKRVVGNRWLHNWNYLRPPTYEASKDSVSGSHVV